MKKLMDLLKLFFVIIAVLVCAVIVLWHLVAIYVREYTHSKWSKSAFFMDWIVEDATETIRRIRDSFWVDWELYNELQRSK